MTLTPADIEQLTNAMSKLIDVKMDEKLDTMEKRFDEKLDKMEKRFDEKLDKMEKRLNDKIDGIDKKMVARFEKYQRNFPSYTDYVPEELSIDTKMPGTSYALFANVHTQVCGWVPVNAILVKISAEGGATPTVTGLIEGPEFKETVIVAHLAAKLFHRKFLCGQGAHTNNAFFDFANIHLHFAPFRFEKTGPSIGGAIFSALISLALNEPILNRTAITSEIEPNGKLLRIGSLIQKLNGAAKYGFQNVIIPKANEAEISESILKEMEKMLNSKNEELNNAKEESLGSETSSDSNQHLNEEVERMKEEVQEYKDRLEMVNKLKLNIQPCEDLSQVFTILFPKYAHLVPIQ